MAIRLTLNQTMIDSLNSGNCDIYKNGVIMGLNSTASDGDLLEIKTRNNYIFNSPPTSVMINSDNDRETITYELNSEKTIGSKLINLASWDNSTIRNFTVSTSQVKVRYVYNANNDDAVKNNNCTLLINGVPPVINSSYYNGDIISLIANDGYEFVDTPYFTALANDGSGDRFRVDMLDDNGWYILNINLSNNETLAVINIVTTQIDIVAGANNLYKITKSDLKQINIDRFVNSGSNPPTVIDYGTNILGVINLPFNINPDLIQNPELIKLGTHETTVTAPKVITDKLYLNLGDISVPMPENSLGFTNATALIHLPYANSLTLDINAVMGQIINVEYVIDLYNGNSYVNIKSNKSDSIIASSSVDLGINIPYSSMLGDNNTVYNSNMSLGGDNHVKTPYIEIIQNMPILGNGFFTAPIVDENSLNGYNGFAKVDDINLVSKATSNEKGTILNILKSGVIIK